MSGPGVVAANYKPIGKATLVGSVDLTVAAWRITFRGCLWHRKGEREWINFAAASWTDEAGQRHFVNIIEFTDEIVKTRFQTAALAAVRALATTHGGAPAPDNKGGQP